MRVGDLLGVLFAWSGALLGLAVGCIYFVKSSGTASLARRLVTSAFGPSLSGLFVLAVFWPEDSRYTDQAARAYVWLQALPFVLLIVALSRYPGPRHLHVLLLPVGLFAWLWVFGLGWLFVHGE